MKNKFLLFVFLIMIWGCAIKYKSGSTLLSNSNQISELNDSLKISTAKKADDVVFFANNRIKKQLLKNGYRSYVVSVRNNTASAILIKKQNFYAIKEYEPIQYVMPQEVLGLIKFNRGLFYTMGAIGVISPFGIAGRKLQFYKNSLFISIPLIVYGAMNIVTTKRTIKQIQKDIDETYLIGKRVEPFSTVSGIIIIKIPDDNFQFIYKSDN